MAHKKLYFLSKGFFRWFRFFSLRNRFSLAQSQIHQKKGPEIQSNNNLNLCFCLNSKRM